MDLLLTKKTIRPLTLVTILIVVWIIGQATVLRQCRKEYKQAQTEFQTQWNAAIQKADVNRENAIQGPSSINEMNIGQVKEGVCYRITALSIKEFGYMQTSTHYTDYENGQYNVIRDSKFYYYILEYADSQNQRIRVSLSVPANKKATFEAYNGELYVIASWIPDRANSGVYADSGELFQQACPLGTPLYLRWAYENREQYLESVEVEYETTMSGENLRKELLEPAEDVFIMYRNTYRIILGVIALLLLYIAVIMIKTAKEYGMIV